MNNNPIGVFDSGIGGLTVAREIVKQLPHESIIYLGDTARVPYGTRSKEIVIKFALELANFLLRRKVKSLVVACNTISAVALDKIKNISPVPILDVIAPAVKKGVRATKNKRIGVIGTSGTIQSGAYALQIKKIDPRIKVFSVSCPLFVPLAEEGLHKHQATRLIAKDYLDELVRLKIDTLILGCTHYPLLYDTITEILGPKVTLIDSAQPTIESLKKVLEEKGLISENNNPTYEFYVTDAPGRVYQVTRRFFGSKLKGKIKKVSLGD
ncbi:glutamate racemase [Candidatus Daviesbacteria bacterium]|nr:glutamate racemase [Candidatus Daviesbacteria bacterium]